MAAHLLLLCRLQDADLRLAHVVGAIQLHGEILIVELQLLVILCQLQCGRIGIVPT